MLQSYIRTIVLYLVMIIVIRILGKRQIGQMEPSEFVVTMMVANLATIPMEDDGIALFSGLVPICVILGTELVLSFLNLKSSKIRKLLCGKPVILIMGPGVFTSVGHFIVVTGYEDGYFLINDPNSIKRTEKRWQFSEFSDQILNIWSYSY